MNFGSGGILPGAIGTGYAPVTYQRLMRLAARAFYNGPCPPPGRDNDNTFSSRSKIAKMDTRGLGIVLVDYLTTVEWTSFELLSEALRLHPVVLSRALRFLEAGHMIRRYERRESRRKKRTVVGEALEADVAGAPESDEEEDEDGTKKKGLLTEYFTIDYARAYDALQVRIHSMRASLKEQLEASNAIQAYRCPGPFCGKTYTSLDAANLVDALDGSFKCEMCGSELVEQRATNDAGGEAASQHATAKESKEAARKLLQAIDRELAPITRLMTELQHRAVPLPDPGELFDWAQRVKQRETELAAAAAASAAAGGGGGGGSSAGGGGGGRAGGAGAGGGAGSSAPAALLAGSGVTVLSAADNTNTWEAQDFKVSLDGGGLLLGGSGAGGVGAAGAAAAGAEDGGKKGASALPWFLKASEGKQLAGEEGPPSSAAGGAPAATSAAPAGGDRGKQQQAEYFRDFMTYMSTLQTEKRAPKAEPSPAGVVGPAAPRPAAAPAPVHYTAAAVAVKAEPGTLAPAAPLGPVTAHPAPAATQVPVVKQEPGVLYGSAGGEMEWEDVGSAVPVPAPAPLSGGVMGPVYGGGLQQLLKTEEVIKQEPAPAAFPGGAFSGADGVSGGGGMDVDADVEWEDV